MEAEMVYFDENCINQTRQAMERIETKISLCAILEEEGELSEKITSFLCEFSKATDKVPVSIYKVGENPEIEVKINAELYPIMAIMKEDGSFSGVSFNGLPGAHELESFILALYNVAGPGQKLIEEIAEKINSIDTQVDIKIGVNLSCTMCPELVQACQRVAALNENVTATMIDIQYFPKVRKQYRVMSVPVMIINEGKPIFGRKDIKELVEILTN